MVLLRFTIQTLVYITANTRYEEKFVTILFLSFKIYKILCTFFLFWYRIITCKMDNIDMEGNMAKRGRKRKKQLNINVVVAVMIIASILLAVLIYTNSGFIGEHLSPFLGGIMGYVKYILPIGVFVLAIYIAYQGETSWSKKIVQIGRAHV